MMTAITTLTRRANTPSAIMSNVAVLASRLLLTLGALTLNKRRLLYVNCGRDEASAFGSDDWARERGVSYFFDQRWYVPTTRACSRTWGPIASRSCSRLSPGSKLTVPSSA